MKKLPIGPRALSSALAAVIALLPLSVCVSLTLGDNALLKGVEHIVAVFILPIAFFLTCAWLIYQTWK